MVRLLRHVWSQQNTKQGYMYLHDLCGTRNNSSLKISSTPKTWCLNLATFQSEISVRNWDRLSQKYLRQRIKWRLRIWIKSKIAIFEKWTYALLKRSYMRMYMRLLRNNLALNDVGIVQIWARSLHGSQQFNVESTEKYFNKFYITLTGILLEHNPIYY